MTDSEIFSEILKGVQTLIFIGGVNIALLIVHLFAIAWGRNI